MCCAGNATNTFQRLLQWWSMHYCWPSSCMLLQHELFPNMHQFEKAVHTEHVLKQIARLKTGLSLRDGTAFIVGWTKTKRLSQLFSAVFPHIVGQTKTWMFQPLSELEVFVIHLVLLSWTSIQLCHPAMRVSSIMLCYDSQAKGPGSLPHIPSNDSWLWLYYIVDPSSPVDRQINTDK